MAAFNRLDNLAAGFNAGQSGHPNVEDGDIRAGFLRLCHRLLACRRFGDDAKMPLPFEQGLQPRSHHRMIVCNQNPHSLRHSSLFPPVQKRYNSRQF